MMTTTTKQRTQGRTVRVGKSSTLTTNGSEKDEDDDYEEEVMMMMKQRRTLLGKSTLTNGSEKV